MAVRQRLFSIDDARLQELLANLRILPEKVQTKVMRQAGRKSAQTVLGSIKSVTPKARKKTKRFAHRPHLRDVMAIKQKTYKGRTVYIVGPKSGQAPHAHLVEFGTQQRFTGSRTQYKTVATRKVKKRGGVKFMKAKVSIGSFGIPGMARINRGRMPAFRNMQIGFGRVRQVAMRQLESEIARGIEREAKK